MKELSIEEKAKAYDEALKVLHKYDGANIMFSQSLKEEMFPELKESEDEKIMKFIKDVLDSYGKSVKCPTKDILLYEKSVAWLKKQSTPQVRTGIEWVNTIDDACDKRYSEEYAHGEYCHEQSFKWGFQEGVDWLEEQSEQKPIDKIQLGKKYKCIASPRYSTFIIGKIYKPEDKFLCSLMNFCSDCFESIEDVEQKPADNIQIDPSEYINNMGGNGCYLKNTTQNPADNVEPKFHESEWITNGDYTWKIVEIKPLDYILQSQDGNIVDDTISHVDEQFHSFTIEDAKDGDVLYINNTMSESIMIYKSFNNGVINKYASYNKFGFEGENYLTLNDGYIIPATKEQCDLLFQKMKEAGYKWDAEKKELKKIEQKPAWSKEDDYVIERLFCLLHNEQDKYPQQSSEFQELEEIGNKLMSFKDRIQPKQEWSEEDERIYKSIIYSFAHNYPLTVQQQGFVKSLRPQNTWKPSDEQITWLYRAADDASKDSRMKQVLNELLFNLKKLREE